MATYALKQLFIDEARRLTLCPGIRLFVSGHSWDYDPSRPSGAPDDRAARKGASLTDASLEQVMQFGGSISADQGSG
ncbi:hypothetical protein Tamer19_48820 [Cupriavidus sp. TA19]|uniref:hypothetical protein n=1 Tax=unclassified Cupriavidus TaxID=2640874 RepID=UPI000E2F7EEC|nr:MULTISPECIES: hypothetical protein [unclassified Cupriavidus]BDB29608.1 hypothetical protein CTP10_R70230 [Cupriavidus sp. P-10]GLC95473.1 hypothetical protein Tamer19_48820 [Cupriavidus sp. TA19]